MKTYKIIKIIVEETNTNPLDASEGAYDFDHSLKECTACHKKFRFTYPWDKYCLPCADIMREIWQGFKQ